MQLNRGCETFLNSRLTFTLTHKISRITGQTLLVAAQFKKSFQDIFVLSTDKCFNWSELISQDYRGQLVCSVEVLYAVCVALCSFVRRAQRQACPTPCLSATLVISIRPHRPPSPLQPSVSTPPPPLAMPPIWLEQRAQAGQPSRSLSKAAEYSSSLGVSPPPLHPGPGPFNKGQVIQMKGGGGKSDSEGLVGWEDEFFVKFFFSLG